MLRAGGASPAAGRSGPARLLDDYLADLRLRGRTGRTVENYRSNVNAFVAFLGKTPPARVGHEELRRFLDHLLNGEHKLSPKTVSRIFSALNSFYGYLEYAQKVPANPVPGFRRRYLDLVQREASKNVTALRQLISVADMRRLALSIADARDRALLVLAAKTGVRRQELINMDVEDVDWRDQSVQLKPTRKRTNRIVFFDDETGRTLHEWMRLRPSRNAARTGPLFTNRQGGRISRNHVYYTIMDAAQALGLHDPNGSLKTRFGPHACRHFFTTFLMRAGMPREYIAWLRGDAPAATVDLYTHIDRDQVREAYRARIPQLGL